MRITTERFAIVGHSGLSIDSIAVGPTTTEHLSPADALDLADALRAVALDLLEKDKESTQSEQELRHEAAVIRADDLQANCEALEDPHRGYSDASNGWSWWPGPYEHPAGKGNDDRDYF